MRAHNYVFNYDHMIQDLSRPADPEINLRWGDAVQAWAAEHTGLGAVAEWQGLWR